MRRTRQRGVALLVAIVIFAFATMVAAAVTYLTAGVVRAFAVRWGVFAEIRDRDVHDTLTPRLGGVEIDAPDAGRLRSTGQDHRGVDEARVVVEQVIPAQNELRAAADELETLVADDLWPLPKYRELLFQY